ncbi:hypothetical protein Z043_123778 [Scleropages formosus]|uniref:Fibronectin type-III domain-containing protein n=1 Tax=Scleropages formosus TaxID=113540 RepID=A0A0P7W6T6_SCLFO|nr:hypothetical protein Z043_123778 [Scleropages formosus]
MSRGPATGEEGADGGTGRDGTGQDMEPRVMPNGWSRFLLLQVLCSASHATPATGAGLLHPPSDVSVDSVNMKHRLTWRPPEVSCATVSYSVQFQGEFELRILNGSWEEVQACQRIGACVCDLSDHLASDSDYELRVRAECGGAVSRWAHPAMPFNRKQTRLAPPALSIHTTGSSAQVHFPDLPPALHLFLTHWQRGDELRASTVWVSVEERPFLLSQLQEGATYCLRAQIQLPGSNRSASSDTHCFSIAGACRCASPWFTAHYCVF